jgi:hypothetical protein
MGSICHHIYFIQNSSVYTTKYQQKYFFFSGYSQDLTEQYLATLIIIKKIPFFLDENVSNNYFLCFLRLV